MDIEVDFILARIGRARNKKKCQLSGGSFGIIIFGKKENRNPLDHI
jgi:hypothetical protein